MDHASVRMPEGEMMPAPRVEVLGVGVDPVTMTEAVSRIEAFIEEGLPKMVVTADASGLVAALGDVRFRSIIENADLVTPDSAGVVWACEKAGSPLQGRVSGVDLVDEICALSASNGYRLYFLGAQPGVAEGAANALRLKHPGVNIVGAEHGYFSPEEEPAVVARAAEAKPDVLFVAMGIPRQEKFIAGHLYEIAAKVSMGVGGSFDVLSGNARRAPKIVQKLRLEWLWRLILNPRKWRKVMSLPRFWWLVVRSGKSGRT